MANYCDYEVRVKGSKKTGQMVYESMPYMDHKAFEWEKESDNSVIVCFNGDCKWSVNFDVIDSLKRVNVDSMSESEIKRKGVDYWKYSLRAKSEAFRCEIMVHYWSEESGFDQFDQYKNGKLLKQRKIKYNYDRQDEFDWNKLEFVGHEGEYDESVDGETKNEDLMKMLMGLGGMSAQFGQEMSKEEQEQLNSLTGTLIEIPGQIENSSEEAGLDLEDGSIGDTGFNMYNWTFGEGKTVKGNGWTIAIPDGFVRIKSKDIEPRTGRERLFELVPITCKDAEDVHKIPMRLMSSITRDGKRLGENWMVHPIAREGVAGILGVNTAQRMGKLMGQVPEVLAVGWADVAAHIIVQDTSGGSYSYHCSVMTEKTTEQLRVQTGFIRDKQKQLLDSSVQRWLKTMYFDKPNKGCPVKSKFEENACYYDLLEGKMSKFEEAVEQARKEYFTSVNGRMKMLEFMGENGLLDERTGEKIKEILESGMAVKLFFLEKADQIIEKLRNNKADIFLLEDIIEKLSVLDDDCLVFYFNDEKITITVPKEVRALRDKWKKIKNAASSSEGKKQRDRLRAIEERKAIRAERKKADEAASAVVSDIKRKMSRIIGTYERSANHHKRMIESTSFKGPWDSKLYKYLSQFNKDIQEMGTASERLLLDSIKKYNDVAQKASPGVVISIINAIEEAIEYVDGVRIINDDLGITHSYNWKSDIPKISGELDRERNELKKRQADFEREEKKQEEEDRRFEEAQEYGVSEKDLDKHKKYLSAKDALKNAESSWDYEAASKMFGSIKGYLNSDSLKAECTRRSKKMKPIEKAKNEFTNATNRFHETEKKLNTVEKDYKKAMEEKESAFSALTGKKDSYEKDKMILMQTHDQNISDCEMKVVEAEKKLTMDIKSLEDTNTELTKTFALSLGKKKALRLRIQNLQEEISANENFVQELKDKASEAKQDKAKALQKLDKDLKSLTQNAQKAESALNDIEKKFVATKKAYDSAKNNMDKKKKEYESIMM